MKRIKNLGFSLVEVVIISVIITLIAGFATVGFNKSLEKSKYRKAVTILSTIHSGQKIHFAKNGTFVAGASLDDLNSDLGLTLNDDDFDYSCTVSDPLDASTVSIIAERSDSSYIITMDMDAISDTNPSCAGSCPN